MTTYPIQVGGIHPEDWLGISLRLVLALMLGGAIGWNRQTQGKAAGLRTHMLVSLGSALFVLMPLQLSSAASSDALSRSIQGVATGVGFLGAGEILHYSRQPSQHIKVKGLTSAASIWVTAALGMVSGCGLWPLALLATGLTLLTLTALKPLEKKLVSPPADDQAS